MQRQRERTDELASQLEKRAAEVMAQQEDAKRREIAAESAKSVAVEAEKRVRSARRALEAERERWADALSESKGAAERTEAAAAAVALDAQARLGEASAQAEEARAAQRRAEQELELALQRVASERQHLGSRAEELASKEAELRDA